MKGTLNKVIIIGRLGADPEIKNFSGGMSVAKISVATNDGYKDQQTGEFVDQTEWHRVTFFGKVVETIQQYARKGSLLYLEGKIKTNKWQDQNGQDRYTTEIIANNFQFLGGKSDIPTTQYEQKPIANNDDLNNFDDDDVPF